MSDATTPHKISSHHRAREACLYVRQSSQHQVINHTESIRRQYGLQRQAMALGWPADRIRIIDDDQGLSGEFSGNRSGFRDLVARVAAGEVGIVLSLEVSRLCRNSTDWHQLLQIAAFNDTLILDEAGVYDPGDSNDRLLLGFKGALSEYELQNIRARLIGGIRNKARRGKLKMRLPIGLVYNEKDEVVLDPDRSIVEAFDLVFETFRRRGSAMQTMKWFRRNEVKLPSRPYRMHGEVHWSVPDHHKVISIIHNPRYAGCFVYGRSRSRKLPDGKLRTKVLPREEWQVCIPDAHAGYIDWDEYCRNQATLKGNGNSFLPEHARQSAPRNGQALLQSRVICGHCGHRMSAKYIVANPARWQKARRYYFCRYTISRHGLRTCPSVRGEVVDAAVSEFVVAAVNQENIALAIAVREQMQVDFAAADRQHCNRIEALRTEADMARRRFMEVDPANRLVVATLESEWNEHLETLTRAIADREQFSKAHAQAGSAEQDERIMALAQDFSKVWNASTTENTDRKRMLAMLIEDVTLTREGYQAEIGLRLRGGKTHILPRIDLPKPLSMILHRTPDKAILDEMESLVMAKYNNEGVAMELNRRGHKDARGDPFTAICIQRIRTHRKWPSCSQLHRTSLRKRGYMSAGKLASSLGIRITSVRQRVVRGKSIKVRRFKVGQRTYAMYKALDTDSSDTVNSETNCLLETAMSQQNGTLAL